MALLHAMLDGSHLTAAAETVGVPPPTAMRWMASLSDTVGVPLTARVGGQVQLTPAGVALAAASGDVLDALAVGVARAIELSNPTQGHIVFGFLRSLGSTLAPELMRGFRAARPGIGFTVVQAAHVDLVTKLHDRSIDVALALVDGDDAEIDAVPVASQPLVLVAPSNHRLARRASVELAELADEPFVGLYPGIAVRDRVDEVCAAVGVRPTYVFETDEVEVVRGLAAAGIGIAVLPSRHVDPVPDSVEIPFAPPQHRTVGLLTSARHPTPPAAAAFIAWAPQALRRPTPARPPADRTVP